MHDGKSRLICAKKDGPRAQILSVGRKLLYEIHLRGLTNELLGPIVGTVIKYYPQIKKTDRVTHPLATGFQH